MTLKDLIREINRENNTRERVYPRWIQNGKIHKDLAKRRMQRSRMIESILREMTDEEFTALVDRIEIKREQTQSKLF